MLAIVHSLIEKKKSDNNKTLRVFYKTDPKMGIQAMFEVLDELTKDDFDELERDFLAAVKKN